MAASPGLDGLNGLTVSADGTGLYAIADGDSSVARFSRNATSGALTYRSCVTGDTRAVPACGAIPAASRGRLRLRPRLPGLARPQRRRQIALRRLRRRRLGRARATEAERRPADLHGLPVGPDRERSGRLRSVRPDPLGVQRRWRLGDGQPAIADRDGRRRLGLRRRGQRRRRRPFRSRPGRRRAGLRRLRQRPDRERPDGIGGLRSAPNRDLVRRRVRHERAELGRRERRWRLRLHGVGQRRGRSLHPRSAAADSSFDDCIAGAQEAGPSGPGPVPRAPRRRRLATSARTPASIC